MHLLPLFTGIAKEGKMLGCRVCQCTFFMPFLPTLLCCCSRSSFLVAVEYSIADTTGASGADGVALQLLTSGGKVSG